MRANITDERYQHARAVYADPICGTDFCDECGDCLHCYSEDECRDGGDHVWVVYPDRLAQFEADHPDATPAAAPRTPCPPADS